MHTDLPMAQVGRISDLQVTRLGMGTAPIGNLYAPVPEAQAIAAIQRAYELGVRFFDTAPLYGAGQAEERLGKALRGVPRDALIIETKVGRIVREDGSIYFDFSRDGVLRSLEDSLRRLGMDRVDILLVHDPDVEDPEGHFRQVVDEAFPTLVELREQGVIRAVGAGMNQWEMEWEFAQRVDVDCFLLAGRYTLLEQTALDFLVYCQQQGIGVFLGGIYNSGILATGPVPGAKYNYEDAPPAILERVRRIQAITERHGVPLHVAAQHFARAHPAVTGLIVGSVSPEEAEDNRRIWDLELPPALWQDLREAGLIDPRAPVPETP